MTFEMTPLKMGYEHKRLLDYKLPNTFSQYIVQEIFFFFLLTLSLGPTPSPHTLFYAENFPEAYAIYIQSQNDPESLFYASICLDRMGNRQEAIDLRKKIYQIFPTSPFAKEALFFTLLETQATDFHLLEESPYLAYFLTESGEKAFKEENYPLSKSTFEKILTLLENPPNSYFLELKHQSFLSLAKIEYALSQKGDLSIHTNYGLAYLRQSLREAVCPAIEPERDFLFALLYAQKDRTQSLKYLDKSLKKYDGVVKAPYLFKLLKLKGELTHSIALLEKAEKAFSADQLPEEELLDLWLTKARLYQKNCDIPSALNQLGTLINSPVASVKRLEAMVLRQEIFRSMGRIDLASRHMSTLQTLREEFKHGPLDHNPQ